MHTLYIDESGDPGRYDANDVTIQSSTKHFTLAGIIVQNQTIGPINAHVQNLIRKNFEPASLDSKFKLHYYLLTKGLSPYDQLSPKEGERLADDMFEIIRPLNARYYRPPSTWKPILKRAIHLKIRKRVPWC